ncbi:hypothetical protein HAX54_027718 [Datura stramonium]|uniref:Uncharacterized protein n=1 Tax=Datura stramonium TaxID=4076 RepID=A0ABS8V578_DATST|nr:hypothetical protein [Datura stramonium]
MMIMIVVLLPEVLDRNGEPLKTDEDPVLTKLFGKLMLESGGVGFVVTGGNPGPDTISNWFKVEKFITTMPGYNYRLRHCPVQFLCPLCNINDCRDVGAKADSGYDRLAVTNQPIPFGFDKVRNKDA